MGAIVWTKDGLRVTEGPDPNPKAFRLVPMYWVSTGGGHGVACGEEYAYMFADAGYVVERTA